MAGRGPPVRQICERRFSVIDRDFRRAVDSHRHVDRPDSAAHEDRRVVPRSQPCEDREAPARHRAHAREHDLAAVGMSREHGRDVERRGFRQAPRVVREQDHGIGGVAEHAGEILRPPRPEAKSRQLEPFAADLERRPRVLQHLDAAAATAPRACRGRRRDCRGWRRRRAVPVSGASSSATGSTNARSPEGHVVAAEHDQIGPLRQQQFHRVRSRRRPAPCGCGERR